MDLVNFTLFQIMKSYVVSLLAILTLTSCKGEPEEPVKEKVKFYIIAGPGITTTGSAVALQLSGTNIETENNITSVYIREVDYVKDESQSVTLKAVQGDPDLILEVSKGSSLDPSQRVAYKTGKGSITVNFKSQ